MNPGPQQRPHLDRRPGALKRYAYGVMRLVNRGLARFDRSPEHAPDDRDDFYANMYLEYIERDIERVFGAGRSCKVLDAGCGTGRLSVRLAQKGHSVTGIDYHGPSLHGARAHAERAGVSLELIEGDLLESLRQIPSGSISVVICAGVLYTCMDHRELLVEFRRILEPGGLLITDFKSRFYMLTTVLRQGNLAAAERVATQSEGLLRLARAPAYYWWVTADEARALLSELGMDVIAVEPMARFFGYAYDGMAGVLDVDTLKTRDELETLQEIERLAQPRYPDICKYIYMAART